MGLKEMMVQNAISSELDRVASKNIPVAIGKILFDYVTDIGLRRKIVTVLLLPAIKEFIKDDKLFVEILEAAQHGPP